VARHPRVVVSILRAAPTGAATLNVEGTLEAAGIAEPVSFTADVVAASPDRVTLRAQLSIDRSRLGMTWSPLRISSMRAIGTVTATFTRSTAG
jgi:polyisoprenoid-binding protein YceI